MSITVKTPDGGNATTISLRTWLNGFSAGWDVDSDDLLCYALQAYEWEYDHDLEAYIAPNRQEIEDFVDDIQTEVNDANDDPYEYCGDILNGTRLGYDPEDFDDDDPDPAEWFLFVDR